MNMKKKAPARALSITHTVKSLGPTLKWTECCHCLELTGVTQPAVQSALHHLPSFATSLGVPLHEVINDHHHHDLVHHGIVALLIAS